MNPLYNGAAKHFELTSLFSFNINFNILYPQLYSTARNHINRLQDNIRELKIRTFSTRRRRDDRLGLGRV